jgi:hypothetical protein
MDRLTRDIIGEVTGSKARIKDLWAEMKTAFWRISRSLYRNPRPNDVYNDIRCFPAFAKRRFTDAVREDILSVVYQNAHRNLDAQESQALETLAVNAGMKRWDLYLWLGERVCGTRGTVRSISGLLNSRAKQAVKMDEFSRALWTHLLEKRGNEASIPDAYPRDVAAVVKSFADRPANPTYKARGAGKKRAAASKRRHNGGDEEEGRRRKSRRSPTQKSRPDGGRASARERPRGRITGAIHHRKPRHLFGTKLPRLFSVPARL